MITILYPFRALADTLSRTIANPNRRTHTIWIHCSGSDNPRHDDVQVIRRWHLQRGWRDVGYHYYITKRGEVQQGRPLDQIPAATKGHNRGAIAICVGGKALFNGTQMDALREHCARLDPWGRHRYRGHCEVSSKACPVFDYQAELDLDDRGYRGPWLDELGLTERKVTT